MFSDRHSTSQSIIQKFDLFVVCPHLLVTKPAWPATVEQRWFILVQRWFAMLVVSNVASPPAYSS